jgi:replicative DNA helicase
MGDKLSEYGHTFQIKLIASLFNDRKFLQQISDILYPEYFESEPNQFIIETILSYNKQYKDVATLDVLKVKLQSIDNEVFKATVIDSLKQAHRHFESSDLEFIKEQALDFCKNQSIKKAILDSVDLLKSSNYDSIKSKMDEAMKAGITRDVGHEYNIDIDDRYTESARKTISTGWEAIDELMDGGLAAGELGVFVAPAGIGKSWALVNIGCNAAKKGLNVIHYTLELNQAYVGLRYDAVITGIPAQNLKYHIEDVKDRVAEIPGQITIKYYPTKGATTLTINSHVEKCLANGFKPDLLIVDYADLLRNNGNSNMDIRLQLGNIYEDLRGLSGELEIPIWTASQANRSALQEDIIQADKISESYNKIMTADFVVSLSRKIEDKMAGTGRLHIIKNRFGPDGITLPSKANLSNGKFDIFTETSVGGQEANAAMEHGKKATRKLLAQKFSELEGKKNS